MLNKKAKYGIGQIIQHRLFDYRGVIFDVDPEFRSSEEWYDRVARSRPPKDKPWYRILVHDAMHETYVAERNLEPGTTTEPINNPLVDQVFDKFENGTYITKRRIN